MPCSFNTRGARSLDRAPLSDSSLVWFVSHDRVGLLSSKGQRSLEHEALELATIADVGRWEVQILLIHPFDLGQEQRCHEPAAAELPAIDVDIVGDTGQLARHRGVAGRYHQRCQR